MAQFDSRWTPDDGRRGAQLVGSLIGGGNMQLPGFIEAVNETAAIETAVALFGIDDLKRKRLAVNLRR